MNIDTNPTPHDQPGCVDTDSQGHVINSSISSDASDAAKQARNDEDLEANSIIAKKEELILRIVECPRDLAELRLALGVAVAAKVYSKTARIKLLTDGYSVAEIIRRLPEKDLRDLINLWNQGKYAAVVYSEYIHLYDATKPKKPQSQLTQLLSRGWKGEYRGEGHKALLNAVHEISSDDEMYHDALPIVQSSGTGKSRLVDYFARFYVTFPLCLRESSADPSQGYPLADEVPRNYLTARELPRDRAKRVASFVSALFDAASEEEGLVGHRSVSQSVADFALRWHEFFDVEGENRRKFYENVVERARSLYRSNIKINILNVVDALNRLEQKIWERCPSWKKDPWIFWAVDEAHTLVKAGENTPMNDLSSTSKSVLSTLGSLLADLKDRKRKTHFFTFFLSTTSILFTIAPPRPWTNSARATLEQKYLPPPFTEITFDPFADDAPLKEGEPCEYDTMTFATIFGRPLFHTNFHNANDKLKAFNDVQALARAKLLGKQEQLSQSAILNASAIAVLGVRLLLEISPARSSSRELNERLVASHLRIAYSIPSHREFIRSGSPSEPLLAHISATLMNEKIGETPYMNVWGLLQAFFEDGRGDQGEAGELVGRVLDIRAMDRTILSVPETPEAVDRLSLRFLARVPLLDYLKQLLTDEAYKTACAAAADGCDQTLSDVFKDAWIHFSHYVRADSSDVLSVTNGWAYYNRGTALQLKHGHSLVDAGIFVHFPSVTDPTVNRHTMTILLRQDKASRNNQAVPSIKASELGVFNSTKPKPYISIIDCVGAQFVKPHPLKVKTKSSPRAKVDDICFELKLYKNHYREFEDLHAVTCAESLIDRSSKDLLLDHPWKGEFHINQVEGMKPTFSMAEANVAWFQKRSEEL